MRFARLVAACAAVALLGTVVLVSTGSSAVGPRIAAAARAAKVAPEAKKAKPVSQDGLGITPGKIKHGG